MIPQPLFQVTLVDPDPVFLRKKRTQSETRRSTRYEANLNRTGSIGAIHKIWKIRFMVPYSVFIAPTWPENCLKTLWAHLELLKVVWLFTNVYVELTASKALKSVWFSKSDAFVLALCPQPFWILLPNPRAAIHHMNELLDWYMPLPLVMFLYCEKLEAETQTENWQWGVWPCLKTAFVCTQVWLCPGLSWPHRIHGVYGGVSGASLLPFPRAPGGTVSPI